MMILDAGIKVAYDIVVFCTSLMIMYAKRKVINIIECPTCQPLPWFI